MFNDTTSVFLQAIDKTIGLRVSAYEEEVGADLVEHDIRPEILYSLPAKILERPLEDNGTRRSSFGIIRTDGQTLRHRDPEFGLEHVARHENGQSHINKGYSVSTIDEGAT